MPPSAPARTPAVASSGAGLRALAAAELQRAIDCLAWKGPRLHAGVHQARKAMRRARAVLALGVPALGPGASWLDRGLRRVIRSLSPLRDAHALVATYNHLLAKEAADSDASAVLRRARRVAERVRAATARTVLVGDPQLQERRALLVTLHAALGGLDWVAVDDAGIAMALKRSANRIESAGARARGSGRDADWHRWRRRARRLSQQRTALGDSAPSPSADGGGKRLAVLLGQAQDYSMLLGHCDRKCGLTKADRERVRALATARLVRARARIVKRLPVSSATH